MAVTVNISNEKVNIPLQNIEVNNSPLSKFTNNNVVINQPTEIANYDFTSFTSLTDLQSQLKETIELKKDLETEYQELEKISTEIKMENNYTVEMTPSDYEQNLFWEFLQTYSGDNAQEDFSKSVEYQQKIDAYTKQYNQIYLEKLGMTEEEYKIKKEQYQNDLVLLNASILAMQKQEKLLAIHQKEQDIMNEKEFQSYSKPTIEELKEMIIEYSNKYYEILSNPSLNLKYFNSLNPFDIIAVGEQLANEQGVSIESILNNQLKSSQFNLNEYLEYYNVMSEDQKKIYSYLLSKEGKESADEYLNELKTNIFPEQIGYNRALEEIKELDINDEGKIKQNLANSLNVSVDGLKDGINNFFAGIENAVINNRNLTVEEYKIMYYLQYLSENSNLLDEVYELGTGVGNMLPIVTTSIVTSLINPTIGSKIGLDLMGVSVYGSAKHQALSEGKDLKTSILYGLLSAGSEMLTEKMGGIIGVADNPSVSFLKRLFEEGKEEFIQSYLTAGIDAVALNKEINLDELGKDSLKSFLMGAAVAGVLNTYTGGINVILNGINFNITEEQVNEILNEAEENPQTPIENIIENVIPEESINNPYREIENYQALEAKIGKENISKIDLEMLQQFPLTLEIIDSIDLNTSDLNHEITKQIIKNNPYNLSEATPQMKEEFPFLTNKEIISKINRRSLTAKDFLDYNLEGVIPFNYLESNSRLIAEKFGLNKASEVDYKMINNFPHHFSLRTSLAALDGNCDLNYEFGKMIIKRLGNYLYSLKGNFTSQMLENFPFLKNEKLLADIYSHQVNLKDYFTNQLYDFFTPDSVLNGRNSLLISKIGLEKAQTLDLDMLTNFEEYWVPSMLNDIDIEHDDINYELTKKILDNIFKDSNSLYFQNNLLKDLAKCTPTMLEVASEYFITKDIDEKIKQDYYKGTLSVEDLVMNWYAFKDKRLFRLFSNNYDSNSYDNQLKESLLRTFLDMYLRIPGYNSDSNLAKVDSFLKMLKNNSIDTVLKIGKNVTENFEEIKYYMILQNDDLVYQAIAKGEVKYDETWPDQFKNKHPELFLPENTPDEIKNKFYNRSFKISDFENDPSLLDYFKDTNVSLTFVKQFPWLTDLFSNLSIDEKNRLSIKIINEFLNISEPDMQQVFKDYIINHQQTININQIQYIAQVLKRLSDSNSSLLHTFREAVAANILNLENPMNALEKLENIFLSNNLPLFGKVFKSFQIIYPDMSKQQNGVPFDYADTSRIAPQLNDSHVDQMNLKGFDRLTKRFLIIYNDLLRDSVKSANRELINYLDNLEEGNNLFEQLKNGEIQESNLSKSDSKVLEIFINHLRAIYQNTAQNLDINLKNKSLTEQIQFYNDAFKPTKKYTLLDRIIRSFAYYAGYENYESIRSDIAKTVAEADAKNRQTAKELEKTPFKFEDGDLLRCIGKLQALSSSLNTGNYSNEHLSTFTDMSMSDTTPLDVDFTLIEAKDTIYDTIKGTPTGFGFGNIFVIIKKDNPNINITRDAEGNYLDSQYDPTKLETFGSRNNEEGFYSHWGIRTGFAFTDIDCIIYKDLAEIAEHKPYNGDKVNYLSEPNFEDLDAIKMEIARNGYYIPVVDFTGKLIFTEAEYDELRSKMSGLSYYGLTDYQFSDHLITEDVKKIVDNLAESTKNVQAKETKITDAITKALSKFNLSLKRTIDGDITPGSAELINTGSSGRQTNTLNDGDFDYLLRIDSEIFNDDVKLRKFREELLKELNIPLNENYNYPNIKVKQINLDGELVDVDLSIVPKNDKVEYSTDACLKDRLNSIKNQSQEIDGHSQYEYVLGNVILAKEVLKGQHYNGDIDAYGKKNGGLAGSGIENWIYQHNGSFIDAAQSFLRASEGKSLQEFKKDYIIWDFGENHYAAAGEDSTKKSGIKAGYLHDNFIDTLTEQGYKDMKILLRDYLRNHAN